MKQILVTVDTNQPLQNIRKAINMLRGVVSTTVVKEPVLTKTQKQQAFVKESLTRALQEVKLAKLEGRKLCCLRGLWCACSAPAADASSPLLHGQSCGSGHISGTHPRQAARRTGGTARGQIRSGSYLVAVVLNGGGGTAVGVHVLLKVRELLPR